MGKSLIDILREIKGNLSFLLSVFLIVNATVAKAQRRTGNVYKLTISEAVAFAKSENKWVKAASLEEHAAGEDRKDVYKSFLPIINVTGSYQRYSGLTLFTDGLNHASTSPRKPTPNAAGLGVDALYSIYNGGRQRALREEQSARSRLAKVNTLDQSGNIGFETASEYLNLVRLNELQKFITDQLKRAHARLENINALYKNQKVTKSDVLRAEVNLSGVELSMMQNENDIKIANQKLVVLLNIPDSVVIWPIDSANMPKPEMRSLIPLVETAGTSSYILQKAAENVDIQQARLRLVQSGSLPNLSFYGAYGVNYPNYIFFPPVDQAYAIGFLGLKAQYSISSLYHNKSKKIAAALRMKEAEVQREVYGDRVRTEINAFYIKYGEALTRISVNEHSVEQAKVNYRIVNTKYLNQLSLLTDLLDADNLYQESRFNLIKAQTDALGIYYHILYSSGNL
ncbi:TolC family protein [Dyadobacter sp. CY356]|uniref:TolC family protein n=1 Tax=Dyadobacter sp. CY356 TaxID=2906442 RepID=UPI001F243809|nr:TolC family protein [Dyadobacter sp. CY356]MCF0055931.1 TolC family protein [Dyadobacter sp. CY356]